MRGNYLIILILIIILSNLVYAEEFNFNDIKPYYDQAYNFLLDCDKNPSDAKCTDENILNMKKTITSVFYTKAARFFNNRIFSQAKIYSLKCQNLSDEIGFFEYNEKCKNITKDVRFFELANFKNESNCGGVFNDRIEWALEDGSKEKTPWNIFLDLENGFANYQTIIINMEIHPDDSDNLKIYIESKDNRKNEDEIFCNDLIDKYYIFVSNLNQGLRLSEREELTKNRFLICFDSYPFLCTYYGRLQYDEPRYVKNIGGYGYGIKEDGRYNLVFEKGITQLDNSNRFPFINYESEVIIFFAAKNQIFKNIEICGNDKFEIFNSKVNLINPSIFDRFSGGLGLPELINTNNINKSINIFEKKNNCYSYHVPSNSEGKEISGYWLYSFKIDYRNQRNSYYSYLIIFSISVLVIIFLPLILHHLIWRNKFPNFRETIIMIPFNILLSSGGLWYLIDKSAEIWSLSPTVFSIGTISVIVTLIIYICISIFMIFIILKLDRTKRKEIHNMKCKHCGHTWKKRIQDASHCPSCRSQDITTISNLSEGSE